MVVSTDLNDCDSPDGIPASLRVTAEKMREQAAELQAAWQDKAAGKPWLMVAQELERAATRIEGKL